MTVATLITHALATAISAFAIGQIENLIHRTLLQRIDRRRAHFRCKCQAIRVVVDHEYLRSTLDHCRVRSHQTNRTGAIDSNAFARQQPG